MSVIWWLAIFAYWAGVGFFAWVGFKRTRYHWALVLAISLLWLPACILAWVVGKVKTWRASRT